jgi:hypothetical protein
LTEHEYNSLWTIYACILQIISGGKIVTDVSNNEPLHALLCLVDDDDDDDKKKKKKKKKGKEEEDKGKDKGKGPGKKTIAAMQEALKKMREEEERLAHEDAERIRREEEAERAREEQVLYCWYIIQNMKYVSE